MITLSNEFTFDSYCNLLKEIQSQGHIFMTDSEAFNSNQKRAVNRHDVDFSPVNSLKLAQIDSSLGITSNFYFLLDSIFYNPLSDEVQEIVKKIKALGHQVDLHIDGNVDCENLEQLERKLKYQSTLWKSIFGFETKSFTFHMNNSFTLKCNAESYAGLFNAGILPRKANMTYISDSNGFWGSSPLDKNDYDLNECVFLLTHPVWWSQVVMTPFQRYELFLSTLTEQKRNWYVDVINKCNRPYPGKKYE